MGIVDGIDDPRFGTDRRSKVDGAKSLSQKHLTRNLFGSKGYKFELRKTTGSTHILYITTHNYEKTL
jgi:hypothetical protein